METPKKITLEHLAPYLPYGLNVKIIPISNLYEEQVTVVECLSSEFVTFKKAPDYYFEDEEPDIDFKPILRPLSDLYMQKFYTLFIHTGAQYDFEVFKYDLENEKIRTGVFRLLCVNHFDVFGLIPAGLAIDINTIDNSK